LYIIICSELSINVLLTESKSFLKSSIVVVNLCNYASCTYTWYLTYIRISRIHSLPIYMCYVRHLSLCVRWISEPQQVWRSTAFISYYYFLVCLVYSVHTTHTTSVDGERIRCYYIRSPKTIRAGESEYRAMTLMGRSG